MRTRLLALALWLGATALAVGVGLSATSLVANRVAGPTSGRPIDVVQDRAEEPSPMTSPSPGPSRSPAPGASAETRTISTVGGSTALRFVDGRVEVVWATPNAGFTADIEDDSGDVETRVDFRSPEHRSRIKGEWADGAPSVETEERPGG